MCTAQVYRLEYPGVLPVVFNLQLEEGDYTDVPEFYLYAVTDLNGRTTYVVNGMLVIFVSCLVAMYYCAYDLSCRAVKTVVNESGKKWQQQLWKRQCL